MASVKVSATDVIQFFKDADLDLATLALSVASTSVSERVEAKAAAAKRMANARAGRKPRGTAAEGANGPEQPAVSERAVSA